MAVGNVGSYPEVNEQIAEKALQMLDTFGVEWRGRDVKAIAEDLCDKIVPLFSNKTSKPLSGSCVDLSKMKVEVVKLAELLSQECEADEESSRLFYYDPVSGAYQVLVAAEKHHKHKKKKWWVIGGIVAVVAAAVIITIATGGGGGPAAQNGAASAIGGITAAAGLGSKEADKKKDNKNTSSPPNDPPPPKPVATASTTPSQTPVNQPLQTKPNVQAGPAQIPHQAQAFTKAQPTSAANVPPVVKHAEVAKATTVPQPKIQQAVQKQESAPISKAPAQPEEKKGVLKQPLEVVKQSETAKTPTPPNSPPAEKVSLGQKIEAFFKLPPPTPGCEVKMPFGPGSEQEKLVKHIASEALHDVHDQFVAPLIQLGTLGINQVKKAINSDAQPLTCPSGEIHKKIDEAMETNLAGRYSEETKELRQKLGLNKTILEVPLPIGLLKDAGKVATVVKAAQAVEKTLVKEEAKLVGKVVNVVEKSAAETRVGVAACQVLKEESRVVGQQKQVATQAEKIITKSEAIAKSAQAEVNVLRLSSNLTPAQETNLFSSAAKAYDQNLTQVAHSFSKHAGRHPEIWGKLKGSMGEWHEEAFKQLQHIYKAPGEFTKIADPKTGLTWIEKRLPDGRGIRLNQDYTFKGFVD